MSSLQLQVKVATFSATMIPQFNETVVSTDEVAEKSVVMTREVSVDSLGTEVQGDQVLGSGIPRNVSVGSSLLCMPNSSRSTDDLQPAAPVTRVSYDETLDVEVVVALTPPNEDSSTESPSITPATSLHERKLDSTRSRKISFSDCDGFDRHPSKKSRKIDVQNSLEYPHSSIGLLSRPEDALVLNPLHVFVRQQIEIFTATPSEMAQPAPGRKTAIRLHQVGLRCIHCKNLPSKDRVKRATCYPSGIGRVYHSVSDMKFDHFPNCRGLSPALRAKFDALKVEGKRGSDRRTTGGSSSSTAQYYHDAALRMGIKDSSEGIFMIGQVTEPLPASRQTITPSRSEDSQQGRIQSMSEKSAPVFSNRPAYNPQMASFQHTPHGFSMRHTPEGKDGAPVPLSLAHGLSLSQTQPVMLLSTQTDQHYLNPLHCFVRRNVEVFVATNQDIAAPSPGRKNRVAVGQVGIRCIHCVKLPLKLRVKRSICYPPSISGIYHSVSNMKFDHFGSCRGLPDEAREEFSKLRSSFNRRGGSTSNGSRGMSNSTAQYYHDSALRLGLTDSADGIRFACGSMILGQGQPGSIVPDGISALMMAAATNQMYQAEYDRNRALSISAV